MSMPGFTAGASVYRSVAYYKTSCFAPPIEGGDPNVQQSGKIIPAQQICEYEVRDYIKFDLDHPECAYICDARFPDIFDPGNRQKGS